MSDKRAPDFFILGGMKCGTTSLFNYLLQHSSVLPPRKKELHYYDMDIYEGMSLDKYLRSFPDRDEGQLSGEGTPFYLTHPSCPGWIKRDFPGARFIIVMRDPVDRFWSHYHQYCKYRDYTGSPESLIEKEQDISDKIFQAISKNPEAHEPVFDLKLYSLLARGRYAEQIARWLTCFEREQFLFLFTSDLRDNRKLVIHRALEFLGLEPEDNLVLDTLHHTQQYEPMPDALNAFLQNYYAPHNKALSVLIEESLPW